MLLEVAAFDPDSALAAARAGADRVELCRAPEVGGLTPPLDWVRAVTEAVDLPVMAMVRPHADGWTFSPAEHAAMRETARRTIEAGASGVVWGALRADGTIDGPALRALVEAVAPHSVTVHRAFDAARDLDEALDAILEAGASRVLTGGGSGGALANAGRLAALVRRAGDALTVMPGGGVRADHVAELVRQAGAREVHSGASAPGSVRVDPDEVRRLRAALDARA